MALRRIWLVSCVFPKLQAHSRCHPFPKPLGHASRHRRRGARCLMDADEIVCWGGFAILDLAAGNVDHELGELGRVGGTFSAPLQARINKRSYRRRMRARLQRELGSEREGCLAR
jgi:hypothetical protein